MQVSIGRKWPEGPTCLLTSAITRHNSVQLQLLGCFHAFCKDGTLPPAHFPPDKRGRRHIFVCEALDGRLAGLNDREIAVRLFGRERVVSDWSDPGNYLRDRTRRAVRRGLDLMQGGYLNFLS
jgi:hypothetical protein